MSAASVASSAEFIMVASEILGPLKVAQQDIITFPHGVFGFPECRSFALLPTPREGIYWLQSVEFSALAFLLVDPFLYFPGHYQIELAQVDLQRIGTRDPKDILVLAIVTMPRKKGEPATANLQAPLMFNVGIRAAYQSLRPDDGFDIREAFDIDLLVPEKTA